MNVPDLVDWFWFPDLVARCPVLAVVLVLPTLGNLHMSCRPDSGHSTERFRKFGNMFWTETAATADCLHIALRPLHCDGGEFVRFDQRVEIPVGARVATAVWIDGDRT